jgi:enoyl-CoA hydratase/carnithine racemase
MTTPLQHRQGGVLQLRLNRPASRNALSMALLAELRSALVGAIDAAELFTRAALGAEGIAAFVEKRRPAWAKAT